MDVTQELLQLAPCTARQHSGVGGKPCSSNHQLCTVEMLPARDRVVTTLLPQPTCSGSGSVVLNRPTLFSRRLFIIMNCGEGRRGGEQQETARGRWVV
jgi:hypothetical protein